MLCQTLVYTVHVPMIIFVKRGQKFHGEVHFGTPKSFFRLPHLLELLNLFAKLSLAHVCTVYIPMIIFVTWGQKLRSGAKGGAFFNPKILMLPHLWEPQNLYAKLSQTYVSAVLCSYDYF